MGRVRTSTLLFFMLLLAWSKVAQGCGGGGKKVEVKYIPGPPGPPGETKTVYVNVPATIPPEVSQHIKKSKCFQQNIVQCEPYRAKCYSCYSECSAAANEYCLAEGGSRRRKRRSVPVGPPTPFTAEEPNIREVLMRQGRIAVQFDLNKDGQLSDEEFQLLTALSAEEILLIAMDGNDDGLIDCGELMQAVKNEGAEVPQWDVIFSLKSLDTDLDGAVSRDEWKAFLEGIDEMSLDDKPCSLLSMLAQYITLIYDQE